MVFCCGIGAVLLGGMLTHAASGQAVAPKSAPETLARGFLDPPNAARPRVWWHWMNGNITERGIDLDLAWMHRVGIGGFHTFDVALNTPTVVDHRLIYMTPEWRAAFRHALGKAEEYGLEVTIASSPGWSETGGPWVQPAEGMKKLVWSETLVEGGAPFHAVLAAPPRVSGKFQDIAVSGPSYYSDVAVLAYPVTRVAPMPTLTTSAGATVSAEITQQLAAGNVATPSLLLPMAEPTHDAWVQLTYPSPQSIQAVALAMPVDPSAALVPNRAPRIFVESSTDGVAFQKIVDIPPLPGPPMQQTLSFPAVTAKYFRVTFRAPVKPHAAGASYGIAELQLFAEPRNVDFEEKAGYIVAPDYYALKTASALPGSSVPRTSIVDLTSKMSADGVLTWTPPAGAWRVVRMGYSLTGKTNHPAPPEATGLEVDQLSRKDVEQYMSHYIATYEATVGKQEMGAKGIRFMLTDSVETGPQNWTDDMLAEFKTLRGYDARPWLPALTGTVVDSPEATDRFLWDYRRTIAQLVSSSHYDTIGRVLHARGLGYYGEALESGRPQLGDDLEMRRATDIPMGAMWVDVATNGPIRRYDPDLRGAASIAHVYGRTFVGAESMTAGDRAWGFAPQDIKPVADMELALGVNRFMIHESAHQPVTDKIPGLTLGKYGQWFNRNETWAEQAKPWLDYLSRCSYMLQQGRFYADLAYFYGEERPLDMQFFAERDLPQQNGYDFVNSDMILHALKVAPDGRLVTPGGASYRVLYLGGSSRHMTVPVMRQLLALVRQGASIAGTKPVDSPSLADSSEEFRKLTDLLWGEGEQESVRRVGKGVVVAAASATEALHAVGVSPDWTYNGSNRDAELMLVHRRLADGDAYFVLNVRDRKETLVVSFAETGKAPELWLPDTGERRATSYGASGGRTNVPLQLDAHGSAFVVFRRPATGSSVNVPVPVAKSLATLDGAWQVSFEPDRGAPAETNFARLTPWNESADPGIRYFSGHATYRKTITAPADWFAARRALWLDLGDVKNLAEVTVNGKSAGTAWKAPFRVDISGLLHPGENRIEVRVVNLWVNRIIGDLQPDATKHYTFAASYTYKADTPLLPSGLLGPVRIVAEDVP